MISTKIRFLEPVDPRAVFSFVAALVNLPDEDIVHSAPGAEPLHQGDYWPINPRISGFNVGRAYARITVEYGAEASELVEEWKAYPQYADDYPVAQRGPRCYVELDITDSASCCYEKHPEWTAAVAARFAGVPMMLADECSGTWSHP